MDNQTKAIIGLLVLIVILVGVFFLKTTGKTKSIQSNELKTEEDIITEEISNSEQENAKTISTSQSDSNIYIIARWYFSFVKKYAILIFIITIILNIGIAKMYRKIGMPMWTVVLQLVSPFLTLINISIVTTIINILRFVSFVLLYKILDAFRVELGSYKNIFIGAIALISAIVLITSKLNILYTLIVTGAILIAIFIIMFHIKMCLNLAENFNKDKGFKLGLIFLPTIFQAILGYQKN